MNYRIKHKVNRERWHDDLFTEVQNYQSRDPCISIEEAWVTHKTNSKPISFNCFPDPLACFFPFGGKADIHKLFQDSQQAWEL
jgi:hypothetical protein